MHESAPEGRVWRGRSSTVQLSLALFQSKRGDATLPLTMFAALYQIPGNKIRIARNRSRAFAVLEIIRADVCGGIPPVDTGHDLPGEQCPIVPAESSETLRLP